MGDSEDDPTTYEKRGLVDNEVIGTGLYETSIELRLGFLALPFADVLEDVPSSADEDDGAFASASKSLRFRLVIASMIA
jgi:hypothetical protein